MPTIRLKCQLSRKHKCRKFSPRGISNMVDMLCFLTPITVDQARLFVAHRSSERPRISPWGITEAALVHKFRSTLYYASFMAWHR